MPHTERGKIIMIAVLFTAMCLSTLHSIADGDYRFTFSLFIISSILFAGMIAFGHFWERPLKKPSTDARYETARGGALRWSYLAAVAALGLAGLGTYLAPRHTTEIVGCCLYLAVAGPAVLLFLRTRGTGGPSREGR